MNAKHAVFSFAMLLLSVGNVVAEGSSLAPQTATSQMTRDVAPSSSRPRVNPWSTSYNPLRYFKSTTTRDAVVGEFFAPRDEAFALQGEDGGSPFASRFGALALAPMVAGSTREHVKSELAQAIRSGDILAAGELGLKLNELNPARYANSPDAVASNSSRSISFRF